MRSRQATRHRPGEAIPELDIYGCDGSCEHSFSATTLGEFPPMPEGCEGSSWVPTQHGETGPAGFTSADVPGIGEAERDWRS